MASKLTHTPFPTIETPVSRLGFGCMRFPLLNPGNPASIDTAQTTRMLHTALDQGVNYFDTAWPYHQGRSETMLGQALKGKRQHAIITTKLPVWEVEKRADCDRFLNEQLKRLQTDVIDFYLFHAVWQERWEKIKQLELIPWMEKVKQAGKIKHFGFSFHGSFDLFKEMLEVSDSWELCQIQYNFLNRQTQAGTAGLALAGSKNLPVIIMEPLMGGTLANPPEPIQQNWHQAGKNAADVSLRWLYDQPGVSTVISGMSALDQVNANIASTLQYESAGFTDDENRLIETISAQYNEAYQIRCTQCGYCMPCPHGVNIPRNFQMFNESHINPALNKAVYTWHFADSEKASACTACGVCETQCPQHIPISEWMPKIVKRFHEIPGE